MNKSIHATNDKGKSTAIEGIWGTCELRLKFNNNLAEID